MLAGLAGVAVLAGRRQPAISFSAGWFFAILASTSIVVPVATQTMAEHRKYLPLAAVVALAVAGIQSMADRPRPGGSAVGGRRIRLAHDAAERRLPQRAIHLA